jgi:hypothetical protein
VHPSATLFVWLCAVVLLQRLPLAVLAVTLACACLLGGRAVARAWIGLLRRSRWIVIVLVATFALMTPGESVWPGLPVTVEGLALALDHGGRLAAVLYAVAWLVAGRSADQLVAALWGIATTARARFFESAVIRLALTLRYAAAEDRQRKGWKEMLGAEDAAAAAQPAIRFDASPLSRRDLAGCALALVATATLWWSLS